MAQENGFGGEETIPDSEPDSPEGLLGGMEPDLVELVESALDELRENDLRAFVESFNLLSFALPSQDRPMVEGLYSSFLDEAKARGVKLSPLASPSCPFALSEEEGEFTLFLKDDLKLGKPGVSLPAAQAVGVSANISMPGTDQFKWLYEAKRVYCDGLESFKAASQAPSPEQLKMALLEAMADFELALAYFPQGAYLERDEKILKEEIGFDYVRCCNRLSRLDPASGKTCSLKSETVAGSLTVFDRFILWALDRLGR
ncbi:MAG: hypothetical protein WC506_00470 [Candidatus Micrarchaeia archaeon]